MSGKLILVPQIIFLLLLSGLICGCLQRTIVYLDVPSEKHLTAISGAVTQDKTLSAIAQIDLVTKEGYQPVRAALVIRKPSYLRLELLPVIGTPDFFLAATPGQMSIFIPSRGEFYRGKPTGANLAQFLSWDFNIEDIVMLLFEDYEQESIIAGKITIKMAKGVNSISVKCSDLKIETTSDLSIFELPVPEGMKIIFLD